MPITIGANITALKTQRRLAENADALSRTFERLSSGLRVNRASDDSASLAIAQSLQLDSRKYTGALRNISDGVSALNIADQAIGILSDITTRLSELAEQSANGVYSAAQRQALDKEAQQLANEYSRIISTTSFNGIQLLNGSSSLVLQVGTTSSGSSRIDATIGNVSERATGLGTFGSGSFSATTTQRVVDLAVGDFNNDGISDVITTSDNGAGTQVWLGNGDGAFKAGVSLGLGGTSVDVGDFNGDGILDVIFEGASNDASVRLGVGDGTFAATQVFDSGTNSLGYRVADINSDGRDDILSIDSTGAVVVLVANSNGSFSAPINYAASGTQNSIQLYDVDGDSRLDALVGFGSGLLVYHGNGDGSFSAASTVSNATAWNVIGVSDFNGDGIADLVVNEGGGSGSIQTLLGNGNGTFKSKTQIAANYNRGAIGDLNGDGTPDLLIGQNSGTNYGLVAFGNGNGTFSLGTTFVLPSSHTFEAIGLGDTNGDGVPDLFAATYAGNSVDVLLQDSVVTSGLPNIDLTTAASARTALEALTSVREQLSQSRSKIGANLSRLEIATSVVIVARQNIETAKGRLMDADIAAESAELVRRQILNQIGASILAQANQAPEIALRLIQGG